MPEKVEAIAAAIEALVERRSARLAGRPDILVGLLGRGIQLSRSPAMHEREAARLGLTCAYVLIDFDALGLDDADLERVLETVSALGFHGVNVTYPFKQAVMPLLDDVASEATIIGAVNTIVLSSRTGGHNTDCWGFAESFRQEMVNVRLQNVTVFGAGGAGSAIVTALSNLGAGSIMLVDPDAGRAVALAARLATTGTAMHVAHDIEAAVRGADGIVNTTPVGMAKHPGTPFPTALLDERQWVADVIYFPRETELLRAARTIGCRTLPGTGMAVGQAVRAFELFTGRAADMSAMADHFEAAA